MCDGTRKYCRGCIWYDMCACDEACDDYTPCDELDDIEVQMSIENRRDEYRRAWDEYVSQYE